MLQGSYYGRWINPDDTAGSTAFDQGFNLQSGVFLVAKEWELTGQGGHI